MNVEIGAKAALFPEKEYINGLAVAVYNFTINRFLCAYSTLTELENRYGTQLYHRDFWPWNPDLNENKC